jgi:hypothetical protein
MVWQRFGVSRQKPVLLAMPLAVNYLGHPIFFLADITNVLPFDIIGTFALRTIARFINYSFTQERQDIGIRKSVGGEALTPLLSPVS